MLQSFKILFQTEDINIYVLRGVYFSRYVQLNIWLSDENASAMKYETGFSREAIYQKFTWQSIKGKFRYWQKLELCKVAHNVKLH